MSKGNFTNFNTTNIFNSEKWEQRVAQIAYRFNKQYQNQSFELPPEVQAMPIFREWTTGMLTYKIVSPFWEIAEPQKNQHCLDLRLWCQFSHLSLARLASFFLRTRNQ